MPLSLHNTLSRKKELVAPADGKTVRFYACGPTVYKSPHIGNYRTYITEDLLRRALEYTGHKVQHAMNITDVGHLVGDEDGGEDKFELSAREEGKRPEDIALFYEQEFFSDLKSLNILEPDMVLRATQAIPEQIALIETLFEKGFAYKTDQAVYFDTAKLADYGKLTGQKLEEKETAAREDVIEDAAKRSPRDFALWFFLAGRYKNHLLRWPSPWGDGFPGWHIECSAISKKLLGQPFDIHAGGIDHIGTHHTNEIAQSEAAEGIPLAHIWMHGEFLETKEKMSKSLGNTITIRHLRENNFDPLSFRYLTLLTHYRQKLSFSWEALEQADNAYQKLIRIFADLREQQADGTIDMNYGVRFREALENDLALPEALATIWELLKDSQISPADKYATLSAFDRVFGLRLEEQATALSTIADPQTEQLMREREEARASKDFVKSDALRLAIRDRGYDIEDGAEGPRLRKI